MARLHGLFSVRTQLLAAIAKWSHQSEERPHLARVLFDGRQIVATDGHRLVVAPFETNHAPFTIDRLDIAVLAAAQREITKSVRAELVFVKVSDGRAVIDLDAAAMGGVTGHDRRLLTVRTHDAKDFPAWEVLFDGLKAESEAPPAYAFEPRYLAAIDEVLAATEFGAGGQRTVLVKAWTGGEPFIGPMLFEGYGVRFLIMPKRIV